MTALTSKQKNNLFSFSLWLGTITSAFAVGVYAYLGTFSRHLADDYCVVQFTRSNFFSALWLNYLTVSDRFSNFMLIALSEKISSYSVAVLPGLMLILWVVGIAWLLQEASHFSGKTWDKQLSFTLALLIVFFAILEAPNRYQTLYWRSSMATHFAPLVFMPYFASFLLRFISSALKTPPSKWLYAASFFIAFLLGGFSEPTVVIMIALLSCGILAAYLWSDSSARKVQLNFLIWSLVGALSSLLVMGLAPANSLRLHTPPPALPLLVSRSFLYAYQFSLNSLRTLPLPSLFSFFMPLIIFYNLYSFPVEKLTRSGKKITSILLVVMPVFFYLLIVASFAPSVYGQSFPVERARFSGQLSLVIGLMFEGSLVGILLAQWRSQLAQTWAIKFVIAVLFGVAALYPLRSAFITLKDLPEYSQRAEFWDAREAYVIRHASHGEEDIIVPGHAGVYGIKEWDDDPNHWVNQCVAAYYGVKTIRAASVPDKEIWSFLSE